MGGAGNALCPAKGAPLGMGGGGGRVLFFAAALAISASDMPFGPFWLREKSDILRLLR
jgi:hypothetical protein